MKTLKPIKNVNYIIILTRIQHLVVPVQFINDKLLKQYFMHNEFTDWKKYSMLNLCSSNMNHSNKS